MVMYPMNLHVVVPVDTCMDKNYALVLMNQESSACVQRANLDSLRRLQHLKSHGGACPRNPIEPCGLLPTTCLGNSNTLFC